MTSYCFNPIPLPISSLIFMHLRFHEIFSSNFLMNNLGWSNHRNRKILLQEEFHPSSGCKDFLWGPHIRSGRHLRILHLHLVEFKRVAFYYSTWVKSFFMEYYYEMINLVGKQIYTDTPTLWLTLLLVLVKSCVNQIWC